MVAGMKELKFNVRSPEELLHIPIVKVAIATVHFLIFVGLLITLLFVQPSPVEPLGYFSFELVAPFVFWPMLVALATTSILLVESDHPLAFPAIVITMLATRLPLLVMFRLPCHPDSYFYMSFIQEWHATGTIDLSVDQRVQFWPVSFLLLYAFRQFGVSELVLWSLGTLAIYGVNALLLYLVLRRFVNEKTTKYGLLVISLAPTFNFYYYETMGPQLLASSIFLAAVLALFAYERHPTKRRLSLFIGLFALLLFTHHLTALLLTSYVFMLLLEDPLALLLRKLRISSSVYPNSIGDRWKLLLLGAGMFLSWVGYLATIARDFALYFLSIMVAVITGKTSTYTYTSTSSKIYALGTYAFNITSLFVYGFRLLPLIVSAILLFVLWIRETQKTLSFSVLSPEKLRALAATLSFGFLMLVSIVLLRGLFLEVPRLFDLVVLFSSILSATWFISAKRSQFTHILRGSFLLAIMIISSSLGMAVHASEFVYYQQEKEAILFVQGTYPTAKLYTDERLLAFARFFAPNADVRAIPPTLSVMLPNQTFKPTLVLVSYHSIVYDQYRPVFGHPPLQVLEFVQSKGRIVYSNNGITVYYLR